MQHKLKTTVNIYTNFPQYLFFIQSMKKKPLSLLAIAEKKKKNLISNFLSYLKVLTPNHFLGVKRKGGGMGEWSNPSLSSPTSCVWKTCSSLCLSFDVPPSDDTVANVECAEFCELLRGHPFYGVWSWNIFSCVQVLTFDSVFQGMGRDGDWLFRRPRQRPNCCLLAACHHHPLR